MALQKQIVPVEIATGIDTKTDPKKVTGKLISLINAVFHESKALLKRFGYASLPQTILNGSSIASGATLSPYQNELVELDGKNLYSYSDDQSSWVNKGSLPVCKISTASIVKNSRGQTTQDQAQHPSGFQVFTWEDTAGGSYYSVVDTGTGQTLVNSVVISATGYVAKPITIGNYVVIFYYQSSSTSLVYRAINMSTPTVIGSEVTIAGSPNLFNVPANSCIYDVTVINSIIHIVFSNTSGLAFYTLSSALTLTSRGSLSGSEFQNIAVFGDSSNNAWVAYYQSTNEIFLSVYSMNFASIVLAQTAIENSAVFSTLRNLTGIVIGTTGYLFYESDQLSLFLLSQTIPAFYGNFIRSCTCTITGTVGTAYNVIRSLGIASKPFVYNGTIYMLGVYDAERTSSVPGLVYDPSTENTYFLVDLNGNIAAKVAQLNGGGISKKFIAPEVITESSSSFQFSYLFKDLLVSESGAVYTQTGVQAVTISFSGVYPSKLQIGKALLLGGGCLYQYDGSAPTELNFHLYPELMTGWVGQLGGAEASGSYEYESLYEWTDNQGQINRSDTSDPLIVKPAPLVISVSQTSGNTTITPNTTPLYNQPILFSNVGVGFVVSGSGIPAGTTVVSKSIGSSGGPFPVRVYSIVLSAAPTSTIAENNITITPQVTVTGSTNDLFTTMTVDPMLYIPTSFHSPSFQGVPQYASDITFLQVGMFADPFTPGAFGLAGGYITALDPVSHKISIPSGGNNGGFDYIYNIYKQFTGTFTSGGFTITGVSSNIFPLLNVGDTGVVVGGGSFTVGSFNAGTSTINLSSSSGLPTGTATANIYFPASAFLKPGQIITGPGIPTNTYIQSLSVSSGETTVTLSQAATSSQTEQPYVITNTYSSNLTVPTIRATNKQSVSLVLYRTQNNLTLLYRVTPVATPVINNPNIDFATISDATSDFNIIGNEQLYTTGGEVGNTSPPASSMITTYKNRAILIPDENLLTWWYSKQVIPGSPVEFSNDFTENIDSRGGPMTAVAAMDDKIIFFKENNIFYVVGDGPTPAGTLNDFSEAQLISSDTGCNNPASIVIQPAGIMFQSPKGIYLLARNLSVQYIGADVESYNTDIVTSANLIENLNQVRFTMLSGVDLVYDYFFSQWSIFTNIAAVDACVYNGIYNYLTAAGLVNQETGYTDNGSFIQMSLTTSWMSLAGLQGFQRVWRMIVLGQYKSPHTLQVNVGVDYASSFEQNVVIPVTSDPGLYQYRIHMKQQKCEAIQFQIQDSQTSSFGEGLQLSEITLEVGTKAGLNKLSAGKSF